MRMMKTDRYLARTVGVSYGAGVLLQFVNNNLIRSGIAEAAMLSVCLLILIALLMKCRRDSCERRETPADPPAKEKQSGGKEEKMGLVVGGLFVLLLLGFGLSEGIEPTEMQLTRFALVFVFGCLGGVFSILRTERHRH